LNSETDYFFHVVKKERINGLEKRNLRGSDFELQKMKQACRPIDTWKSFRVQDFRDYESILPIIRSSKSSIGRKGQKL